MTERPPLRAYLVDDEPLALRRLERLLSDRGDVTVVGTATDPEIAIRFLNENPIDVLFLDIQMPGTNGFELLERVMIPPWVVFTTAFDEYALRAFDVNSIDYLLKPIERSQLDRALSKLSVLHRTGPSQPLPLPDWVSRDDVPSVLATLAAALRGSRPVHAQRVASRLGERIQFLPVSQVTHFVAEDKLTYAIADGHRHVLDDSLASLEAKLDPQRFARIHRATIVNLGFVDQLVGTLAGGVLLRLKDRPRTELSVARDRVTPLKKQLGL